MKKNSNPNFELFTYLMEKTNLSPTDIIDVMLNINQKKSSRKEKIKKIYEV